jgi:hypothetical protein
MESKMRYAFRAMTDAEGLRRLKYEALAKAGSVYQRTKGVSLL